MTLKKSNQRCKKSRNAVTKIESGVNFMGWVWFIWVEWYVRIIFGLNYMGELQLYGFFFFFSGGLCFLWIYLDELLKHILDDLNKSGWWLKMAIFPMYWANDSHHPSPVGHLKLVVIVAESFHTQKKCPDHSGLGIIVKFAQIMIDKAAT